MFTDMKRIIFLTICLILHFTLAGQDIVSFSDGLEYDPFYGMLITDSEGSVYTISNGFYQNSEGELKYFVWFRRGTDQGLAEYPLDLYKIRRLTLTGDYEIPPDGYTPCEVELTSGNSFEGFLDTSGYLAGMDEDFGSFVRIYLQYNGVKSIEFLHQGTYSRCPFCGALFYNRNYEICPFDETPLIPQNGSVKD
ncbi:MAG: hypothetical protein B6241_01910 [Spirochaetaceae bacterium 4572_59]|nr:MAG: hypothetical protein B6241_01910 [Spirochaetaceae bacterium 4572_59]